MRVNPSRSMTATGEQEKIFGQHTNHSGSVGYKLLAHSCQKIRISRRCVYAIPSVRLPQSSL